jgi:hypothetical protein
MKSHFLENEQKISILLRSAYHEFQERYCEYGYEKFVPLTLYQSAFFDYLELMGLDMERQLWAKNKQGFLLLHVDDNIDIGGISGAQVVLGKALKAWPRHPPV